nr:eukaryotic initiation factor 4A-9-like [Tanacetum cinerariifolium]
MVGVAAEGSQFDTRQFDSKMDELLLAEGQDFFTSYDEVIETFDAMGFLKNLLRDIYAYGFETIGNSAKGNCALHQGS